MNVEIADSLFCNVNIPVGDSVLGLKLLMGKWLQEQVLLVSCHQFLSADRSSKIVFFF